MSDLDDGYDEILSPPLIMRPQAEYQHDIEHIKRRYDHDMISVYDSPEFRMLKARLKRIVGEIEANEIMNDNL